MTITLTCNGPSHKKPYVQEFADGTRIKVPIDRLFRLRGCLCNECLKLKKKHPKLSDPAEVAVTVANAARATSRLAAAQAFPRSGTQRMAVLQAIANAPDGLTDEEICHKLRLSPKSENPRRYELVNGGWIEGSGKRRHNLSGSVAMVWVLSVAGEDALRSR